MAAYYNEFDPFAAEWLRELIKGGHIAPGDVDERSIEDVRPDELVGYDQCHFFAGIGGWSFALRIAGWPDDQPVWTGSCPCQPFSIAGKATGFDDERHLWPAFHWLIAQLRPTEVFGEQVASKNTDAWFDLVQADLESMGYAFGCVPFASASIGAPHIRDRAYWVGHASGEGLPGCERASLEGERRRIKGGAAKQPGGASGRLANRDSHGCDQAGQRKPQEGGNGPIGNSGTVALDRWSSPNNGVWANADWLHCRDGKWRPVESGTFPLAHGVSNRVGLLRGYGNAINPWQAAEFVMAYMEYPTHD